MAKPQLEDGYTKIANDILESLARIRISGEARQVFDVILRQTYGWNQKEAEISLKEFQERTGLKKPIVCRAIKKLIQINIIIKKDNDTIIKKDNDTIINKDNASKTKTIINKDNASLVTYGLQKDFEKWQPLSKKITLSKKIMIPLSIKIMPTCELSPPLPQIFILKKKERKTYSPDSDSYKLSELLFNRILKNNPHSRLHACQNGNKETIIQRWAKDIDLLIRKDGQHPSIVEKVILFTANDNFWGPNVQSGAKLREKWDTLVAQMKRQGVSTSAASKLEKDNAEEDIIIDPSTGNPAKTIILSPKTRKTIQEKFKEMEI